MNIRPLSDRVLVVGIEEKEKTAGGIVIPDTAKEKPQVGSLIVATIGAVVLLFLLRLIKKA